MSHKYKLEYEAGKIIDEKRKETNKILEWISSEVYGAGEQISNALRLVW